MRKSLLLRHRFVSSNIKSIQRGTITLADTVTSATATIGAVDPNNTRLIFLGNNSTNTGGAGSSNPTSARIALTNATTVTASRITGTDLMTVSYEVIEYYPGVIKSVQRGTVTMTATASATATITAVDTNKATLESLGDELNNAHQADIYRAYFRLTNTTTVQIDRVLNNGNYTRGFQVTEWL